MNKTFKDGFFRAETGEVVEVRFINGVLNLRFMNEERFTELRGASDGWSWDYCISVKPYNNDILLSKGDLNPETPRLYKRIESEK